MGRGLRSFRSQASSIEEKIRAEVIGSIRRALIVVVTGRAGDDLKRLTRLLSGAELTMEGQSGPAVLLSQLPRSDNMVRRYTGPAPTWATVTPMILPGYDDPRKLRKKLSAKLPPEAQRPGEMSQSDLVAKLDRRIDYLIRKAIRQAGYPDELAGRRDQLEPGELLAGCRPRGQLPRARQAKAVPTIARDADVARFARSADSTARPDLPGGWPFSWSGAACVKSMTACSSRRAARAPSALSPRYGKSEVLRLVIVIRLSSAAGIYCKRWGPSLN